MTSLVCVRNWACSLLLFLGATIARGQPCAAADDAAVEQALPLLKAGDTLTLQPGVYRGGWTLAGLRGAPSAPIIIRGMTGAVIRAAAAYDAIVFWGAPSAHVVLEGLRIEGARRGGVVVFGSSNITIRGCIILSNGVWGIQTSMSEGVSVESCEVGGSQREHGIYFSTTDRPLVRDCLIRDNAACGIHLNGDLNEGGDGMITGAVIVSNRIERNGARGGAALNMDGVEQSVVAGNRIENNLAGGVVIFRENGARVGAGNIVRGNRIRFVPDKGRFGLRLTAGATGTVVENNVIGCGRGPALEIESGALPGLVWSNNKLERHGMRPPVLLADRPMSEEEWNARVRLSAL